MENALDATWDDLRVLLALHRQRSFLAVGKALGISTSTAARRIAALESSLGRALVHRSSAGTSIEPDALELVALAEQLELGLKAVRRDEGEDALSGSVRISLGDGFVRPATRLLCDLRRKHPGLQIELMAEVKQVDLARREADIGIRKLRSASPALMERAVGRLQFGLYAAPAYVERRLRGGRLADDDFARHDFVGYEGPLARGVLMEWLRARGARHFPFLTNSDFGLQEAAEQGAGICLIADAQGRDVPGLVRLDFAGELPSHTVYLVFHRELRQVPRFKLVIATLDEALRAALSS
jgi:DNA-binding transcriptional LysR family regulator